MARFFALFYGTLIYAIDIGFLLLIFLFIKTILNKKKKIDKNITVKNKNKGLNMALLLIIVPITILFIIAYILTDIGMP